ncbi:MAG: hypothetical protein QM820_44835 [Minicystis sp.]
MNPKNFDDRIKLAFDNYGKIGVKAVLLAVNDRQTEHGEWTNVLVEVTVMDQGLTSYAEEWRFGGVTSHEKLPIPYGLLIIDRGRLIGAAKAATLLPPGFPLDSASCTLHWALVPAFLEPEYAFIAGDTVISIGGYTGRVSRGK